MDNKTNSSFTDILKLITFWTMVSIPLGWGIYMTVKKVAVLFY